MSSNNPPFTPFCTKVRGTVDISSPTLHVLILPAEAILSPKGAFGHTHSSVTGRLRPRRPLPPRPKPSSCRWAPSVEPMVRPPAGFGPGDRCAENDAVFFPKGAFGRVNSPRGFFHLDRVPKGVFSIWTESGSPIRTKPGHSLDHHTLPRVHAATELKPDCGSRPSKMHSPDPPQPLPLATMPSGPCSQAQSGPSTRHSLVPVSSPFHFQTSPPLLTCAKHQVYITMCMCVSIFINILQGCRVEMAD